MAIIITAVIGILGCWGSYSLGFSRGVDEGFDAGKAAVHRRIERLVAAKRATTL